MNIQITPKYEHFEIYVDGQFHCSADNWREVDEEIAKLKM